jgi:Zn-dependent protease with chaperone function
MWILKLVLSTSNGAIEQLQNVYGAEQIRNLREVRSSGEIVIFSALGSSIWIVGILGAGAAFLYLTPWVLMVIYGGLATWMGEKITNQSVQEYTDTPESETTDNQHKKQ